MLVLTPENDSFDMNTLPPVLEDDLRFCVLDYTNLQDVDFIFPPCIFLDVFSRPCADLQIGQYRIQLPLDWAILIADKNFGQMEMIELKDLRDRPFEAFILNPLTGYMPDFGEITHLNNFPDVTWSVPKLKYGHILVVPLKAGHNPPCILCAKDIHRLPDTLDITKIFT